MDRKYTRRGKRKYNHNTIRYRKSTKRKIKKRTIRTQSLGRTKREKSFAYFIGIPKGNTHVLRVTYDFSNYGMPVFLNKSDEIELNYIIQDSNGDSPLITDPYYETFSSENICSKLSKIIDYKYLMTVDEDQLKIYLKSEQKYPGNICFEKKRFYNYSHNRREKSFTPFTKDVIQKMETLRLKLMLKKSEDELTSIDNLPFVFKNGKLCKMKIEYLHKDKLAVHRLKNDPNKQEEKKSNELHKLFIKLFNRSAKGGIRLFNQIFEFVCILKNYGFNWSNKSPQKWLKIRGYERDYSRCGDRSSRESSRDDRPEMDPCQGSFGITEVYKRSYSNWRTYYSKRKKTSSYDDKLALKRFYLKSDEVRITIFTKKLRELLDETKISYMIRDSGKEKDPGRNNISEIKKIFFHLPSEDLIRQMINGKIDIRTSLYFPSILMEDSGYNLEYYCGKIQGTEGRSKSVVDLSNISKWQKELAEGLKYMNENNYYHQDIKPVNVCVKEEGFSTKTYTIKIIDFGYVKRIDTYDRRHYQRVGSPYTMYTIDDNSFNNLGHIFYSDIWAYIIMVAYMNLRPSHKRKRIINSYKDRDTMRTLYEDLFNLSKNGLFREELLLEDGIPHRLKIWEIYSELNIFSNPPLRNNVNVKDIWTRVIKAQQ